MIYFSVFLLVFSSKIVVHLQPIAADKLPGPVASSPYSYIRFSFTEGGQKDVSMLLKILWIDRTYKHALFFMGLGIFNAYSSYVILSVIWNSQQS